MIVRMIETEFRVDPSKSDIKNTKAITKITVVTISLRDFFHLFSD